MKKSRLIILSLTLLSLALSGCKTSPVRESGFDLLSEANWGLVSSTSSLEKDDYLILVHNNGEDNYTFKHFEDDSFNAISVNLESEEVDQNISQFLLGINEVDFLPTM